MVVIFQLPNCLRHLFDCFKQLTGGTTTVRQALLALRVHNWRVVSGQVMTCPMVPLYFRRIGNLCGISRQIVHLDADRRVVGFAATEID
jgi:hypothetical protein